MAESAVSGQVLAEIIVFLAATSILIPALRRVRLSAVMGFLLIGMTIGPHGLGSLTDSMPWLAPLTLSEAEPTHLLAEFGVVFLLFIIGLEVSTDRLRALRRLVFGLGTAQLLLTSVTIAGIAAAFGNGGPASIIIGLSLALSSTAVVLQVLEERRQLSGAVGRAAFSVLLLQDLAVVPVLFIVGALGPGATPDPMVVGFALVKAVVAVGLILLAGKLALRPFFRWVAAVEMREVFVAAALLVVIGTAGAAAAVGLSMALGAFLAGLLLAETEFRHQIETDLDPFKGLLLGLFFVTVGMQIDPRLLLAEPVQILIGVLGLFLVKGLILIPVARVAGLGRAQAVELGCLLGQAGEFAFVAIGLARGEGALSGPVADYMLIVVALSIFLTPAVAAMGGALAGRIALHGAEPPPEAAAPDMRGHVLIAGYGRVGQALGEILANEEIAHVALDGDVTLVRALRGRKWPVHFGDASRREVLARLGAGHAAAIVVTMDKPEAVERIVIEAKAAWPHVPVYARARDAKQARKLHAAGAAHAFPEAIEASLLLGEALLEGLGLPDATARRIIGEWREVELARTRIEPGAG